MGRFFAFLTFILLVVFGFDSQADERLTPTKIPRMASLKSGLINARSGPGKSYPIEFVYKQKGAPVEIIAKYDNWYQIKDWQDTSAWMHENMVSKERSVKVMKPGIHKIYKKSNANSQVIAKVEDGAVGYVKKCPVSNNFCLVEFDTIKGWLPRDVLFGIYPKEVID